MSLSAIFSPEDLKKRRVTVMGLGKFGGGLAAVQYLVEHGADVTITDQAPAETLAQSLDQIDDLPLRDVFLGGHPDKAFEDCELIVVNPAVRPDNLVLKRCGKNGVQIATEIQLLLQHLQRNRVASTDRGLLPAIFGTGIVAVTGSNGKSTTAALIHHVLSFQFAEQSKHELAGASHQKCWLGGNIGGSLLPVVDQIDSQDIVVLELSSFQLHYLRNTAFAPDVAVLTGFSANHLDWHPDLAHYHASKQNLFRKQSRGQAAILPASHQVEGRNFLSPDSEEHQHPEWRIRGQLLEFGTVDDGQDGVFWEEDTLLVRNAGGNERGVEDAVRVSLPGSLAGDHNLQNLTAAACAAMRCGAEPALFSKSVPRFPGLPFRMAVSGQNGRVRWINDSASTTPEATIAAVQTFRRQVDRQAVQTSTRLVVIVGGADKGGDPSHMLNILQRDADGVVLIGEVSQSLANLLQEHASDLSIEISIAEDFSDAFRRAVELVASAGIVVLSPGYSSFGWFRDYVDRGRQFDLLVEQWIQK